MKIVVCYIAVTNGPITADYAARFCATYHEFPAGIEHEVLVIANGGPLPQEISLMFEPMKAKMYPRANDPGWDVSAYQDAARGPCASADMMFCCGESVYFHREGWLARLVDAWKKHGPGMYGPYASNTIRGHLNTTAFFTAPAIIRSYPLRVSTRSDRYQFEHGENALWRRVAQRGLPVRMVTWDGEWPPQTWRSPRNILWRGDQSNTLCWCNHTQRFAEADAKTKQNWLRTCDQAFR